MRGATRTLLAADFIEKWVSRSKIGTNWNGGLSNSERNKYTPQMAMRGSPYPKYPGWWGIPSAEEAVAPNRPPRDMPKLRPFAIDDLTPAAARAREARLPGVLWQSELPQDPVDKLFFQVKPENAELLYTGGNPDNPEQVHEINLDRGKAGKWFGRDPLSQMIRALDMQNERRERFITVMARDDTKQIARLLLENGLIAGMRDYNNNWKFSIETKWWDNRPAVENMQRLSLPERGARWYWNVDEVRKVMYYNKVYNVVRLYFIKLDSGEIVTHPVAFQRKVGGEPLCYVD
eukprot:TRINITY_DN22878_c0_g1_i1.p2 TRINITY_DN22878_c0_g1~~TRINITY_DN22878_c0_g1_i1.p2  ORF type:complete len:290 (+),score=121.18 TRINITY_DN22878_c0_g1_i1:34-903(+)